MNNTTDAPIQGPVTFTEAAVMKIMTMMAKDGKAGHALRFGVVTGGCAGLSYDMRFQRQAYDNDIVYTQHGLTIFINKDALEVLKGVEVDYVDTLKENGFKYRNPGAKSSCGCGTSFS